MLNRGKEKRLLRDLARLRKLAGKIQDMDVFTACALTVHVDGEQDCAVRLAFTSHLSTIHDSSIQE
jgi:hypothetical protein